MSTRIKLVRGDTLPSVIIAMTDKTTNTPIDVSASDITVRMRFVAGNATDTVLSTIAGTKLTGQVLSDGQLDTSVTTPGAGGRVQFTWPAGALDVEPGLYEGEVAIEYNDGRSQTVYDRLHFRVREAVGS